MDVNSLVAVTTANPRKPATQRTAKEDYSFHKTVTNKGVTQFTVTRKFFEDHGLKDNSLKQFNGPDGIAVAVLPGNAGVFFKNTEKGPKGRTFKNDVLNQAMLERGMDNKYYALDFIGEKDGVKYFKIRPVRTEVKAEASESTEAVGSTDDEQALAPEATAQATATTQAAN